MASHARNHSLVSPLLQLQDDRSQPRDVFSVPSRLGIEVTELSDALPLGAGLDLGARGLELLLGGLRGCSVSLLQFGELKRDEKCEAVSMLCLRYKTIDKTLIEVCLSQSLAVNFYISPSYSIQTKSKQKIKSFY